MTTMRLKLSGEMARFLGSLTHTQTQLLVSLLAGMKQETNEQLAANDEPRTIFRLQGRLSVLSEFSPPPTKDTKV